MQEMTSIPKTITCVLCNHKQTNDGWGTLMTCGSCGNESIGERPKPKTVTTFEIVRNSLRSFEVFTSTDGAPMISKGVRKSHDAAIRLAYAKPENKTASNGYDLNNFGR